MNITIPQLAEAAGCAIQRAAKWHPHLLNAMQRFGINTPVEAASFIAQLAHESGHFSRLSENLNYSADGLAKTWPSRYRDKATGKPNTLALLLHRRPQAIANNAYADRMGNGNVASGDGWRYRGRGPIQITGKNNYRACGHAIGRDLLASPDLLLEPECGALSAGWFWHVNGLDKHDDDFDVMAETRIINGGKNGLADRQRIFNKALKAFGVTP